MLTRGAARTKLCRNRDTPSELSDLDNLTPISSPSALAWELTGSVEWASRSVRTPFGPETARLDAHPAALLEASEAPPCAGPAGQLPGGGAGSGSVVAGGG